VKIPKLKYFQFKIYSFWSPVLEVSNSICLSEAYFLNYIAPEGNMYSQWHVCS